MKSPALTNVHVASLSECPGNTRYLVGWTTPDGMRWHYETTLERKTPQVSAFDSGTLFKNPPMDTTYRGAGYFVTRHLDPEALSNRAMVKEAIRICDERMLWTAAVAELAAKLEQRDKDNAERFAEHLKKEAGPALFEALKLCRATLNAKGGCTAAERDHATLVADTALLMATTNPKG